MPSIRIEITEMQEAKIMDLIKSGTDFKLDGGVATIAPASGRQLKEIVFRFWDGSPDVWPEPANA